MIGAGARYFAVVFAIAFALGTIRTIWIAPAIGATAAVLVELPIILVVSFFVARHIITGALIGSRGEALGVGAVAFAMLMVAEAGLAVLVFGQPLGVWLADLWRAPGIIGLAGQIVFALMPFLVFWQYGGAARLPPS